MSWRLSILRNEQYRALGNLTLSGRVLDLGGGKNAEYQTMVGGGATFVVGNISPHANPDILFDAQKPFPIENESFDHIVCMNVLEHVYEYQKLLKEAYRVIKKEGTMIASTPFMYRVHGSPDDFFRYTDSALTRAFTDAGFVHVEVTPLGKGPLSIFYQSISGAVPTELLQKFFLWLFVGADSLLSTLSFRYKRNASHTPIGYFVIAKK